MKRLMILAGCLFLLSGCGGAAKQETAGVQELKPGERTVIDAPAPAQPAKSAIQERDI